MQGAMVTKGETDNERNRQRAKLTNSEKLRYGENIETAKTPETRDNHQNGEIRQSPYRLFLAPC